MIAISAVRFIVRSRTASLILTTILVSVLRKVATGGFDDCPQKMDIGAKFSVVGKVHYLSGTVLQILSPATLCGTFRDPITPP